jgi:hypothetical protein
MWKLLQIAIVCVVCESDYQWHWAPPHSILAPVAGTFLALLVTMIYFDIKAGRPKAFILRKWRALSILLLPNRARLLPRDHRR